MSCIVANRFPGAPSTFGSGFPRAAEVPRAAEAFLERSVPDVCICGRSWTDSDNIVWACCHRCGKWQHLVCGGFVVGSGGGGAAAGGAGGGGAAAGAGGGDGVALELGDRAFVCQQCDGGDVADAAAGLVRSGCTLIVCPATLLPQWESEIRRHTTGLNVVVRTVALFRPLAPN
jgi:E3 ubiquitin-protein ligase SHPRH